MDDLELAFKEQSRGRIKLDYIRLVDKGEGQQLECRGVRADGGGITTITAPFTGSPVERAARLADELAKRHAIDPLTGKLENQIYRIQQGQTIARALVEGNQAKAELRRMGKLQAVAERIKDTKAKLEAEADKLASRLDDLDKKAPAAFDRGHSFLDAQHADLTAMEAELRQLSNLPLDGSQG